MTREFKIYIIVSVIFLSSMIALFCISGESKWFGPLSITAIVLSFAWLVSYVRWSLIAKRRLIESIKKLDESLKRIKSE